MITSTEYSTLSGWTAWRYAVLVGTAPPQTVFRDLRYQDLLANHASPVVDVSFFRSDDNRGIYSFIQNLGLEINPLFFNHYPDSICDRMHYWSPLFSVQDIVAGDNRLLTALQERGAT